MKILSVLERKLKKEKLTDEEVAELKKFLNDLENEDKKPVQPEVDNKEEQKTEQKVEEVEETEQPKVPEEKPEEDKYEKLKSELKAEIEELKTIITAKKENDKQVEVKEAVKKSDTVLPIYTASQYTNSGNTKFVDAK